MLDGSLHLQCPPTHSGINTMTATLRFGNRVHVQRLMSPAFLRILLKLGLTILWIPASASFFYLLCMFWVSPPNSSPAGHQELSSSLHLNVQNTQPQVYYRINHRPATECPDATLLCAKECICVQTWC